MTAEANYEWVDIRVGSWLLAGRLFQTSRKPKMAIVIHAATGVPQKFYTNFATWLAEEHDAAVLTYDYRGIGLSRGAESLQMVDLRMSDWGIHDQSAALDFLFDAFPDLPVCVIGHSLGGLYLSAHAKADKVARAVCIGSGPGDFMSHPWSYMPNVIWFWFLGGPWLTALHGYLPGRLSGLGSDLPAKVYWEWRRFCLAPRLAQIGIKLTVQKAPPLPEHYRLTTFAVSDDPVVTPAMVRKLGQHYTFANVDVRMLRPADFGLKQIGHLRLFSSRNRAAWPALVEPLLDVV